MRLSISSSWRFLLIGLMWLAVSKSGQAWERPPVKVNTQFQFHIEVKVGPQFPQPSAPWYSYFPADARMTPPLQSSPYPTWPTAFPPPAPSTDKALQGRAVAAPGPMLTQQWPTYYTQASNIQPAGFVPAQVPSYWYQQR
jgi:hypothetical protein